MQLDKLWLASMNGIDSPLQPALHRIFAKDELRCDCKCKLCQTLQGTAMTPERHQKDELLGWLPPVRNKTLSATVHQPPQPATHSTPSVFESPLIANTHNAMSETETDEENALLFETPAGTNLPAVGHADSMLIAGNDAVVYQQHDIPAAATNPPAAVSPGTFLEACKVGIFEQAATENDQVTAAADAQVGLDLPKCSPARHKVILPDAAGSSLGLDIMAHSGTVTGGNPRLQQAKVTHGRSCPERSGSPSSLSKELARLNIMLPSLQSMAGALHLQMLTCHRVTMKTGASRQG